MRVLGVAGVLVVALGTPPPSAAQDVRVLTGVTAGIGYAAEDNRLDTIAMMGIAIGAAFELAEPLELAVWGAFPIPPSAAAQLGVDLRWLPISSREGGPLLRAGVRAGYYSVGVCDGNIEARLCPLNAAADPHDRGSAVFATIAAAGAGYQFELWDGGVLRLELAYVAGAPFARLESSVERALQQPIQGFEIGILLTAW